MRIYANLPKNNPPTFQKIIRQPSEKYFANRRKSVAKQIIMVHNIDSVNESEVVPNEELQKTNR